MGQQSFKTVQSQLLLLSLLTEYLAFLDTVPGLAMEVAHRLVELVKVLLPSFLAKHLSVKFQMPVELAKVPPPSLFRNSKLISTPTDWWS